MSDQEIDSADAALHPQIRMLKINTNLRALYGGANRGKLPVLEGMRYNPSDLNPVKFEVSPRDVRSNRCTLKFSPWVDAERFFSDIGYSTTEHRVLVGGSYNVNTSELGRALGAKAESFKAL